MRNVDRLARHIAKNGAEGIMVHTIPGTSNWLICQKIDNNKWLLTLASPLGNVTYNLGTVSDAQHIELWGQLIKLELESKVSQTAAVKKYKDLIHNFSKKHVHVYKKFTKQSIKNEKRKRKNKIPMVG